MSASVSDVLRFHDGRMRVGPSSDMCSTRRVVETWGAARGGAKHRSLWRPMESSVKPLNHPRTLVLDPEPLATLNPGPLAAGVELKIGDGNEGLRTRGALPKGTTRK